MLKCKGFMKKRKENHIYKPKIVGVFVCWKYFQRNKTNGVKCFENGSHLLGNIFFYYGAFCEKIKLNNCFRHVVLPTKRRCRHKQKCYSRLCKMRLLFSGVASGYGKILLIAPRYRQEKLSLSLSLSLDFETKGFFGCTLWSAWIVNQMHVIVGFVYCIAKNHFEWMRAFPSSCSLFFSSTE